MNPLSEKDMVIDFLSNQMLSISTAKEHYETGTCKRCELTDDPCDEPGEEDDLEELLSTIDAAVTHTHMVLKGMITFENGLVVMYDSDGERITPLAESGEDK